MGWGSLLSIYLLIWVVTLFAVLPWGVRTPQEEGADMVKGQADSAPVQPMLIRKLLWTTLISAIIGGILYAIWSSGMITVEDLPSF